jgi:hypothetical protein
MHITSSFYIVKKSCAYAKDFKKALGVYLIESV